MDGNVDRERALRASACSVCGHSPMSSVCPECGVDADRLQEIMLAGLESDARLPLKRSGVRAHMEAATRLSEQVWDMLRSDFKERALERHRRLSLRSSVCELRFGLPVILPFLLASFWVAAGVSAWLLRWPESVNGRWLFACGVVVASTAPLGLLAPALYEKRMGRDARAKAAHGFLLSLGLIGLAVLKRCPTPWYLSGGFWVPATVAFVIITGRAVLELTA